MIEPDGVNVFIEKPYIVVLEAKRTVDTENGDSEPQLLAQIRSLQLQ